MEFFIQELLCLEAMQTLEPAELKSELKLIERLLSSGA
jgi:hypothetical protein